MSPPPAHPSTAQESLLRLAAPLVLSFWMRSLFTFVDTAYASLLGDAAIAAIGLAIPLEFAFIATWVGLSTALTSYLSKAIGQDANEQFDQFVRTVRRMVVLLVPFFLAVALGIYLVAPHLGLDPDVARGFQIYGSVLFGGSAVVGFWSVLPDSIVKAHHDTRATMMAGIWSNVTNVVLNTFFIFVLHWGLFGIALSTVLGRVAGLAYALWRASALERERRARSAAPASPAAPVPRPATLILRLAFPSSATFMLMATEGLLVNYLLSSDPNGTAALAAYSIFHRVFLFALMPLLAVSVAMLPFVGRYMGQGRIALVRSSFFNTMWLGALYCIVLLGPACWFGAEALMRALADGADTVAYGVFGLRLVPLAALTAIPFQLCRPLFEGMQLGRPSFLMALLRYVALAPPLAFAGMLVAESLGEPRFHGLMLGLVAATASVSAVFLFWTRRFLASYETAPPAGLGQAAESYAGT
jgi:Na+-driven multidrug efflux pump